MNNDKYRYCRYKVIVTDKWMCYVGYGETIDEINAKIDKIARENKKPLKAEIYTRTDINRHPCLADWKLIETKEIQ